ncbi:MAG: ABC transporter permease [Ardenticatenaceae bacterium]|nr:ABC transporter permease [Anaerolineales bacterium]MCB8921695.1 ABC transporter permease [Ardenticatenaceae bacterium]MCB8990786.1 ABC transporter permease [Ardenticatenaceae bacterium]MCB9003273.1 ABC transporter permease [Ardenticatenaceae bacterium]
MLQKIFAMIWKDTIVRFSNKSELLFFLILPVVFTALMGGILTPEPDVDARVPLLLVNEDSSALAASLQDALAQSDTVQVQEMALAEAETAFTDEEAAALLLIPAGFGEAVMAGETAVLDLRQQPNNSDGDAAGEAVRTAVSAISQPVAAARSAVEEAESHRAFASVAARDVFFASSLEMAQDLLQDTPERIVLTQPESSNVDVDDYDPAAQSSAGQLVTWVFIPLLGVSAFLAYERTQGTLRRLLTTPTRKATFLLGSISSNYVQALVQMAILVAFGVFVMKVNWGQSLPALAVLLLAFGLAAVAFGVMLGTFVKTTNQASNLSIMLGMVMALLGGCWWPAELFPPAMQTAVKILPTAWVMQGMTDLIRRGQGLAGILPEAGVLLGFAVVFFVLGVWRFRFE